jgi:predicted nucleotidyltransferase
MPERKPDLSIEDRNAASQAKIQVPMAAIEDFCRRWQVKELALFGSVLREDFNAESDIDVLVTFAPDNRRSLFDLVDMQDELAALLRRKVDLVTRGGLRNPYRRHEILTTRRVVYAA